MTRGRLSPALATTSRIRAVGFCAARSRRSVLTDTADDTTPRDEARELGEHEEWRRARGATTKGAWPARKTEGDGGGGYGEGEEEKKEGKKRSTEREREERRQAGSSVAT